MITGWSVGALICLLVDPDRTAGASVDLLDARVYDYNVERMGGKAALFAVRFNQWLGGLWHGRSLGITVAVLALILALACFWLDGLLSERPVENGERDASDTKRGADRY